MSGKSAQISNPSTFALAATFFNNRAWDQLGILLADKISVFFIDDDTPSMINVDKQKFLDYLNKKSDDDIEQFTPIDKQWNDDQTIVSGRATWLDNDGSGAPTATAIIYRFRFNDKGLINYMYGAPA